MAGDIDLGDTFEKLPDVLEYYEKHFKDYDQHIKMRGKTLEEIATQNPVWFGFYSEKLVELKKILAYMESRVAYTRGKLYKSIKTSSKHALGEREINRYIDAEDWYMEVNQYMLEVKELHDLYYAAVDNFRNVGYSLNNIVKLKVASMEDIIA